MDRRRQQVALAVASDLAAVVVFALVGSRSHDGDGAGEVLMIAAPFAVGTLLGWLLSPVARRAPRSLRAGWHVWAWTLAVGMVARRFVFGRGTAITFVVVSAVVLAVLIVGWRWIRASRIARREIRSPRPPSRAER